MNKTVERYLPLVAFLEVILGRNYEIALHDFNNLDHSLVDIRNGYVSGRQVGAPATDFALRVLNDPSYAGADHTDCYVSYNAHGMPLRSASYFIREEGTIVGMLCINVDASLIDQLAHISDAFSKLWPSTSETAPALSGQSVDYTEVEHFALSPRDLILNTLSDLAEQKGKAISALDTNERVEIMRTLDANGAFLLKGAVSLVADVMDLSEPSVYRYLQKARRELSS